MAYYPDLLPYEYAPSQGDMRNVGWLSRDHEYSRGAVPLAFAHELDLICNSPVDVTRGRHVCELCAPPSDIIAAAPKYEEVWEMFHSGNGEIRVCDAAGVTYCAPAMVIHYVAEHQYQPPAEFIEAVLYQRELRCRARES